MISQTTAAAAARAAAGYTHPHMTVSSPTVTSIGIPSRTAAGGTIAVAPGMGLAMSTSPSLSGTSGAVTAMSMATSSSSRRSPVPSSHFSSFSASPAPPPPGSERYLWQMSSDELQCWIRGLHNGALFPIRKPTPKTDMSKESKVEAMARIQKEQEEEKAHVTDLAASDVLLRNLLQALHSASTEADGLSPPSAKRAKTNTKAPSNSSKTGAGGGDLYSILDTGFIGGKDVIHTAGAILSRLTAGGLTNALSGRLGGVVDVLTNTPFSPPPSLPGATPEDHRPLDVVITTAANLTLRQLLAKSRKLHHTLSARVEMDMLQSTPARIVEMLCPDVGLSEISSIRKRIYDTVILGKGTNASIAAAALEGTEDLPVAARIGQHDIDKWKKCKACGNNDQSSFVMDRKNGDLICTNCGTVATESLMHEGSQYRKFEGEADRNHHGDAANPLYSNGHNMSTTLGGVGIVNVSGQLGGSSKGSLENILKHTHAYIEMNVSQFGKEEKKTRIGYKDRQKRDAFIRMGHVGDALGLHEAVVQRAKELFAGFRDDRELVQQFKGVVAACLCEAFDQLSRDGKQILKMKTGEVAADDDEKRSKIADPAATNARAARRQDLHSATMAGMGGLMLPKPPKTKKEDCNIDEKEEDLSPCEKKTAATWNLDDVRAWLLEASKSIAKKWSEQREEDQKQGTMSSFSSKDSGNKNNNVTPIEDIPQGTKDELEGQLVGHTLTLCDSLEKEFQASSARAAAAKSRRVITPRVKEMGRLSIKWQHSHERGSGGKGGVGNSGRSAVGKKPGEHNGRTAGQILILKTAKKLGGAIGDRVAGEAFHRELRALLSRQENRRKKDLRAEATMQRFNQMKRKPWLQARTQM